MRASTRRRSPDLVAAVAELRIGDELTLPLTAVTETFAILAKRGAGKTNTAVVLTEEMVAAGQQVVVLDPTGVWWGLRSTAAGHGGGLPVVIVGGDHADLPLQEGSGRAVARLLVTERASAVLDLSGLSKVGARELVADVLEELYAVNRAPMHLVVDEADLFAPQRQPKNMVRLAGAMEDIARRGRAHGIGLTLICQRAASLSWDVLSQAEVLVALRVTNPRDVAAIEEWVKLHADVEQSREVKASLPSLPVGTAWVWSPGWLDILQRVQVRARHTFDSSATPVPGAAPQAPRLVDVDVAGLRTRLLAQTLVAGPAGAAATTLPPARAAANSVVGSVVGEEVGRLQEQVRTLTAERDEARDAGVREVPVLDARGRADLAAALVALQHSQDQLRQLVERTAGLLDPGPARTPERQRPPRLAPAVAARHRPDTTTAGVPVSGVALKAGAVRMMQAMVDHHPTRLSRAQLATLAGMKVTGGTFGTYLSALRRGAYLAERGDLLEVTDHGLAVCGGHCTEPTTAEQVQQRWRAALKAGARRMLGELIAEHPAGMSRGELAERVGIELTGGTYGTYLSTLRRNGLVDEGGGQLHAADVLFLSPGAKG
jgi:hypothetical protein